MLGSRVNGSNWGHDKQQETGFNHASQKREHIPRDSSKMEEKTMTGVFLKRKKLKVHL